MANLGLPGLFTGIDTRTLIAQLMALERRTINVYQERKNLWEERKNALGSLETSLSTLRTTLSSLSDAEALRAFSISSSDSDKVTAEASHNTFEGSHTVVINQLANAERWVQTGGLDPVPARKLLAPRGVLGRLEVGEDLVVHGHEPVRIVGCQVGQVAGARVLVLVDDLVAL